MQLKTTRYISKQAINGNRKLVSAIYFNYLSLFEYEDNHLTSPLRKA